MGKSYTEGFHIILLTECFPGHWRHSMSGGTADCFRHRLERRAASRLSSIFLNVSRTQCFILVWTVRSNTDYLDELDLQDDARAGGEALCDWEGEARSVWFWPLMILTPSRGL